MVCVDINPNSYLAEVLGINPLSILDGMWSLWTLGPNSYLAEVLGINPVSLILLQ